MHRTTGSLHCSHFLLGAFDFSIAILLISGQVKVSCHLGKGTKVEEISGKVKFRFGFLVFFFPFCFACLLVKFTVCPANLGACVQGGMEPTPD